MSDPTSIRSFFETIGNANIWSSLSNVRTADPLILAFALCIAYIVFTWSMTIISSNYSWVDRFWSIMPPSFVAVFAARAHVEYNGMPTRLAIMLALSCAWGARLTFNYWRKGGYLWKTEDYRWAHVQEWPMFQNRFIWQAFNLSFIAIYQCLLLFSLTFSAWVAYYAGHKELNGWDYAGTILYALLLLMESAADQQQWNFQTEKYRRKNAGEALDGDYKLGFLTSGLFRISRHPNFFAEISLWHAFYLFAPGALLAVNNKGSAFPLHWTLAGPVLLMLLFQGSTWLTEVITSTKYPAYKRYQRTTSRLIPWLPGPSVSDD